MKYLKHICAGLLIIGILGAIITSLLCLIIANFLTTCTILAVGTILFVAYNLGGTFYNIIEGKKEQP